MKHKPGLAILIANKAGSKQESEADDEGALAAMEAFIAAVKDDDAETALEEYRNLCACCEGGEA